jgi:hypothetical protein
MKGKELRWTQETRLFKYPETKEGVSTEKRRNVEDVHAAEN